MQFTQPQDVCSDITCEQIITFEVVDGGAGKYVRFNTTGWAIDSLGDFAELYGKVRNAFEMDDK
jgi:hypothetical protein